MKTIVRFAVAVEMETENKEEMLKSIKEYDEALRNMGFQWMSSQGQGLQKWKETFVKEKE